MNMNNNNNEHLEPQNMQNGYTQYSNYIQAEEPKTNIVLKILSFIFPIVGIVLFFDKKKRKPKEAKTYGKYALFGIIINFIILIIISIIPSLANMSMDKTDNDDSIPFSENFEENNEENNNDIHNYDTTSPNTSENLNDFSFDEYSTNSNYTTLGGERQGYIKAPGEVWSDFKDLDYESDEMIQFTNGSEIITMSYWDGTNASKIDVLNSITLAVQNASQRNSNALYLQTDKFLYDDFYAETIYTVDHPDYKCFGMYFQSDKTHDMLFFSIESPGLSDSEFENLVNELINNHSFVTHKLDFKIKK